MDNLFTLTAYSGSEKIAQMMHLTKKEAKFHKKQLLLMCKGEIKKVSIEVTRE
jgi:hypothetical protein